MEKWDVVIRLRQDVNAVLEAARAAKRIGKALEAHVSLEAQDDAAGAALEAVRELDLAEICIVSSCALEPVPEEATQGQGANFRASRIGVTEAKGRQMPPVLDAFPPGQRGGPVSPVRRGRLQTAPGCFGTEGVNL